MKEYDTIKKEAADAQRPSVFRFFDALSDLCRKSGNELKPDDRPARGHQKEKPKKALPKYPNRD